MDLNGVQVGPFGPKLCQNDAPDLRIIFQALLGPKNKLKKKKKKHKLSKSRFLPFKSLFGVSCWSHVWEACELCSQQTKAS